MPRSASPVGAGISHPRLTTASDEHDHLVGLYETDEFLIASVVEFLTPALTAGEPAIVVATPEHAQQIGTALAAAHPAAAPGAPRPRLLMLDAAELLAGFMVDGEPDPERFRAVVGAAIRSATAETGRPARIFGEMVTLLWADGNVPAAIAVEDLWNDLAASHPFALLCAYPTSAFARPEHTAAFRAVCAKHHAVIPSESHSARSEALSGDEEPLRTIALLQQAVDAGESERDELRAGIERLHEIDRLRTEFVAMVAHDIRNPAAIVSALLAFLHDNWQDLDDDEIRECLGKAMNNTGRIQRLTGDVMTVARLETGDFPYDLAPVDLVGVIEGVISQLVRATDRTIELSAEPDPPKALADPDRQVQIIHNLLTNAAKFSPGDSTVTVQVSGDTDQLVVRVRDEGDGIAEPDLGRLFRPFSRIANGRSDATQGTGLGLYITKALVEGQGGTIAVDSTVGRGSTFTYTVPTVPHHP